jgi:hypothetical protein
MATATLSPPEVPAESPEWVPYRMTAEEYFKAVEADVFPPDRRIELWEGQIYEKMARKRPHSIAASKFAVSLLPSLPKGWFPWLESPILIDDFTAPLPDLAIIRGEPDDYGDRGNPTAGDIGVVIELADSNLRKNRTKTLAIYARAGLPCYWLVNLVAGRVEVYSKPRIEGEVASYASAEFFEPGNDVPLVLDNREVARIPVSDLVPQQKPKPQPPGDSTT